MGGQGLGDVLERSMNEKISVKEWGELAHKWNINDKLPWENIDVGINDSFLKDEYNNALNGNLTPWCEEFVITVEHVIKFIL